MIEIFGHGNDDNHGGEGKDNPRHAADCAAKINRQINKNFIDFQPMPDNAGGEHFVIHGHAYTDNQQKG